jgi:hypothetical protein
MKGNRVHIFKHYHAHSPDEPVFIVPLVFSYVVLGCAIGAAVGRRLWSKTGAVALGMILGLLPGLIGVGGFCWMLWRSNLLPR